MTSPIPGHMPKRRISKPNRQCWIVNASFALARGLRKYCSRKAYTFGFDCVDLMLVDTMLRLYSTWLCPIGLAGLCGNRDREDYAQPLGCTTMLS